MRISVAVVATMQWVIWWRAHKQSFKREGLFRKWWLKMIVQTLCLSHSVWVNLISSLPVEPVKARQFLLVWGATFYDPLCHYPMPSCDALPCLAKLMPTPVRAWEKFKAGLFSTYKKEMLSSYDKTATIAATTLWQHICSICFCDS